jgi:hypothetical protein
MKRHKFNSIIWSEYQIKVWPCCKVDAVEADDNSILIFDKVYNSEGCGLDCRRVVRTTYRMRDHTLKCNRRENRTLLSSLNTLLFFRVRKAAFWRQTLGTRNCLWKLSGILSILHDRNLTSFLHRRSIHMARKFDHKVFDRCALLNKNVYNFVDIFWCRGDFDLQCDKCWHKCDRSESIIHRKLPRKNVANLVATTFGLTEKWFCELSGEKDRPTREKFRVSCCSQRHFEFWT